MSFKSRAEQLAELISFLKTNDTASELQEQFYNEAENPKETGQ